MPSTVEQLSPTRVKITVEVPFQDLKPSLDKAYADIARTINVPGFRRGKVPPMVIDQRFGRGVVIQEAFNDSWSRFYGEAVTANQLTPLASPDVEVTKLEDGDLIEFTAEVDVRPDFEVPDASTIAVQVDALEVADGIVDQQLDVLRRRFGSRTTVERAAADGDLVTLKIVASENGEPLPDATAEDIEYTVGSGQMIDGLDEAVTGLSVGESATFRSTLVGGPLKDEEADIEITVGQVQAVELPELDDDFAQEASEFDTIDELRASITSMATNAARLEQATQARDAVLESLVDSIDLAVPEKLLASELEGRRQQITSQLAQAGLTLEQYLADSEDDQQTEEEFWADVERRSTQSLKAQMVLDKVAESSAVD
ncbi:MAG TPA: trigger factor, partial [Friedmanniella sp.]